MACICGHAEEEHETKSGSCEGTDHEGEACECAGYEPDDEDDAAFEDFEDEGDEE